jgi:uncharacterized protein
MDASSPSFEWSDSKRDANLRKHGLDFVRAGEVFDGRPQYTYSSPRGHEVRFVTIAFVSERFVALVWTERGFGVKRLISLRRARDVEKRAYRAIHG